MPLTTPVFVHTDAQRVLSEMKADVEVRMGRVLAPADVEMLLVNAFAYRETLIRTAINDAALQCLVPFSRGSALDALGLLVGVSRLPADAAKCTLRFALVAGHGIVTIPQGTRVQTTDGKVAFATVADAVIQPVVLQVDIDAAALDSGEAGNDYAIGTVSIILDPLAFVSTAANIDITSGGADDETDEELRSRIEDAPNRFSVAGPTGAYKFFAKSASPAIVDVAVMGPEDGYPPGEVHIFPLLKDGALPNAAVLNAVLSICNDEKVRPLTDTVIVAPPTSQSYAMEVELTLINGTVDTEVLQAAGEKLTQYTTDRKNRLGWDVIRQQISGLCMLKDDSGYDKVYNVNVVSPAADIITLKNEYTLCTGITLTVTGYHDR